MYLLHADVVSITDPRTLKPSTIVTFVPFEHLYGAFPTVFQQYELTLGRLHIVAKNVSVHIQIVKCSTESLKITLRSSVFCVPFFGFAGARSVGFSLFCKYPLRDDHLALFIR